MRKFLTAAVVLALAPAFAAACPIPTALSLRVKACPAPIEEVDPIPVPAARAASPLYQRRVVVEEAPVVVRRQQVIVEEAPVVVRQQRVVVQEVQQRNIYTRDAGVREVFVRDAHPYSQPASDARIRVDVRTSSNQGRGGFLTRPSGFNRPGVSASIRVNR